MSNITVLFTIYHHCERFVLLCVERTLLWLLPTSSSEGGAVFAKLESGGVAGWNQNAGTILVDEACL